MPDYFAQSILRSTTGNTRDDNINTFAIGQGGVLDQTTANAWELAMRTFYNTSRTVGALLGRSQSGHLFKIYEVTNVKPNYPKFEYSWALTNAPGAVEMPTEVALAISYVNTAATTIPRGRRRGRIYMTGFPESENLVGRPTLGLVEGLADAYTTYANAVNANMGTHEAGVWSRASANVWPIQQVFCDNEWDTMRSRGGRATQRFTKQVI